MYSRKNDGFNQIVADTLNLHTHHKSVYIQTLKHIWTNDHPFEATIGIEKRFMMIIITLKIGMPSFWIRHFCEKHVSTKRVFEAYVIAKPILFMIMLMTWAYHSILGMLLTVYLLLDLITYILGILALSDIFLKPVSVRKNLILLGANYREIISGFAIFYLHWDAISFSGHPEHKIGYLQAIYYSISTFSTVGFGDITASSDIGTLLSILQLIVSIIFIGIILSSYVGKIKLKGE